MRLVMLLAVGLAAAGAAAAQQTAPNQATPGAQSGRVVYVCDRTAETKRGWTREHGEVTYVSAADLAKAEAAKEAWSKPRCITEAELQRYERAASDPARLTRARGD